MTLPVMKNTVIISMIGATILVTIIPGTAHALQTHASPEGLYVHQIGHVLFAFAMLGFAFRIRRTGLYKEKAWRFMSTGAMLFALWNVWAILGHYLTILIPQEDFSRGSHGLKSILVLHSPLDFFYYILKMDHLICFPALFLFYLALRRMTAQSADSTGDRDKSA